MEGGEQKAFVVCEQDNVATALGEIEKGSVTLLGNQKGAAQGEVLEHIPIGHKFALREILAGEDIVKYGAPIGRAIRNIHPGEHVHLHNIESRFDQRASTYDTETAEATDTEYQVY